MIASANPPLPELHVSDNEAQSWLQRNRRNLPGIGYVVADLGLAANGLWKSMAYRKFDREKANAALGDTVTGFGWTVGGLVKGRYGEEPFERRMARLEYAMERFFAAQGHGSIAGIPPRGLGQKIEDFLYKYPSEVLNAVFALMSIPMGYAGYKTRDTDRLRIGGRDLSLGWLHVGSAALVMGGALAGLLIKESAKDADGVQTPGVKPLYVSGWVYFLNNVVGVGEAALTLVAKRNTIRELGARSDLSLDERNALQFARDTRYAPLCYMASSGIYGTSNILLSKESRATPPNPRLSQAAAAMGARYFSTLDPKHQEQNIRLLAEHLHRERLGLGSPGEIAASIRARLDTALEPTGISR